MNALSRLLLFRLFWILGAVGVLLGLTQVLHLGLAVWLYSDLTERETVVQYATAGATRDLRFGGPLRVRVVRWTGQPMVGMPVLVRGVDASPPLEDTARTDVAGLVEFASLGPRLAQGVRYLDLVPMVPGMSTTRVEVVRTPEACVEILVRQTREVLLWPRLPDGQTVPRGPLISDAEIGWGRSRRSLSRREDGAITLGEAVVGSAIDVTIPLSNGHAHGVVFVHPGNGPQVEDLIVRGDSFRR